MYRVRVETLNHHHRYRFWTVVREGGVTRERRLHSRSIRVAGLLLAVAVSAAGMAFAQSPEPSPPPPPPPHWTGSAGAGLAITSGNSDTRSYNAALSFVYDPKTSNVFKLDGLYLRADTSGEATADKTALGARGEHRLGPRLFGFAEVRYLRDRFKLVTYLIAPSVGIGYHVVKTDKLAFDVDAGVGGAFEKDTGQSSTSSGSYRVGETLAFKPSPQATLSEAAAALWKTRDSSDAYYHFEASLATPIGARSQLKLAFIDDFKNLPPSPTVKKNDTSLLVTFLLKL